MIIIPARLASTRFKDKILCDIGGVPMFVATTRRVSSCDDVVVAVDDESVFDIARKHGLKAVMTNKDHQSGTDRINEAAQILGLDEREIIINVQADEPFIEPENIAKFKAFCEAKREKAFMFSCYKLVSGEFAMIKTWSKSLPILTALRYIFHARVYLLTALNATNTKLTLASTDTAH